MSCYTVGVDLGQAQDYSAAVAVERVAVLPPGMSVDRYDQQTELARTYPSQRWRMPPVTMHWHVRLIHRWASGTPYPSVVAGLSRLMTSPALEGAQLVVDKSGVGRAVWDQLVETYRAGQLGDRWPHGLTITGGATRTPTTIPKVDLLDGLLLPLQQGRLRIARGMALGDRLEAELTSFRRRISASGATTFDHGAGEGHGDIVIAAALALAIPNRRPSVRILTHEQGAAA